MAIDLTKSTHRELELERHQLRNIMISTGLGLIGLDTSEEYQLLVESRYAGRRIRVSVYDWIFDCHEDRLKIFYTATPIAL